MIDLTYLTERKVTFAKLVAGLTPDDLRALTNQMIDRQLALIADCNDAAVVFELLMGSDVAPRKEFIVQGAYDIDVATLDA